MNQTVFTPMVEINTISPIVNTIEDIDITATISENIIINTELSETEVSVNQEVSKTNIEVDAEYYVPIKTYAGDYEPYDGEYTVTPRLQSKILPTTDKVLFNDITITGIPITSTSNPYGGRTVIIG